MKLFSGIEIIQSPLYSSLLGVLIFFLGAGFTILLQEGFTRRTSFKAPKKVWYLLQCFWRKCKNRREKKKLKKTEKLVNQLMSPYSQYTPHPVHRSTITLPTPVFDRQYAKNPTYQPNLMSYSVGFIQKKISVFHKIFERIFYEVYINFLKL